MNSVGYLLSGIAALLAVTVAVATLLTNRRGTKESNEITERFNEFQIMEGTIDTLRDNLREAQEQANTLRHDLAEARKETRKLQNEVTTALANVAILSDHIRLHIPADVPFPKLRRVVSNGG